LRRRTPCLVLGAGPTGLSAAYHYGSDSAVVEREAKPGGSCRSIEDTGFTFDLAGHVMLSDDPYVQDLYRLLLGDNVALAGVRRMGVQRWHLYALPEPTCAVACAEPDARRCALRLSAARRLPGVDERIPAVAARRARAVG
jgi:protoporphyrinogen oxidase